MLGRVHACLILCQLITKKLVLELDILGIAVRRRHKRGRARNQSPEARGLDFGGAIFIGGTVTVCPILGRIELNHDLSLFHHLAVLHQDRRDDAGFIRLDDF